MAGLSYDQWLDAVQKQKEHIAKAKRRKEEHEAVCMVGYADCADCRKLSTNHSYDVGDLKVMIRKFQKAYPLGRN